MPRQMRQQLRQQPPLAQAPTHKRPRARLRARHLPLRLCSTAGSRSPARLACGSAPPRLSMASQCAGSRRRPPSASSPRQGGGRRRACVCGGRTHSARSEARRIAREADRRMVPPSRGRRPGCSGVRVSPLGSDESQMASTIRVWRALRRGLLRRRVIMRVIRGQGTMLHLPRCDCTDERVHDGDV